ncbi:Dicer-like protein 1 [Coemansia sp. RSA 1286]|nr:Dicer-like protein 1 [Coemansia sp. RSA 485]KAJ2637721.1 Dicer-like protein 1 [Coemansia sp. RSA 1286]
MLADPQLLGENSSADLLEEWHSSIQPRDYQLALFKEALQDNSVVMLETGTGKTLVSVMLIQWFARRADSIEEHMRVLSLTSDQSQPIRRKTRVFLNNTVALVYQQARVISENTNQKVHAFVGAMGLNDWDDQVWSKQWGCASVLVMTHQVLLNALRAGRVHITDIDLLVFDECHHARGNHPYALIMREFYDRCDPKSRPHVFGMTASPLNAKETASESVQHLQAVLDSNICTVDLTARADLLGSKQMIHLCYEYRLPPDFPPTPLTLALAEKCFGCQTIEPANKLVAYVLAALGPYGVDQMWHHFIRQWHRRVLLRPATTDRPANPPLMPSASLSCSSISTPVEKSTSTFWSSTDDGTDSDQSISPNKASKHFVSKGSFGSVDNQDNCDKDTMFDSIISGNNRMPISVMSSPRDNTSSHLQDVMFLKMALAVDNMFGGEPYRNLDQLVAGVQSTVTHIGTERSAEMDVDDDAQDMHPTPLLCALSLHSKPWDQLRSQLSPQVNRLLGILHQWCDRPNELRGIVFTSRRITAVLLVYIVSQISDFSYIRSDVLLGGSSKNSNSIASRPIRSGSVRVSNQAVLADFAKGRLNLIFATQVAEEGVDIQPCNLVIRFDMPDTTTSMIQSRGRARMSKSQFIVMVPEIDAEQKLTASGSLTSSSVAAPEVISCDLEPEREDDTNHLDMAANEAARKASVVKALNQRPAHDRPKTYADYLRLVSLEECLREWCLTAANKHAYNDVGNVIISGCSHEEYGRRLRRMRVLLTIDHSSELEKADQDEPWIERNDSTGRIYIIKSTNASITYLSAISIVQHYIQLLPQDDYFKLQLEVVYEEKIVEQPRLQDNIADQQDAPVTNSRKKRTKPVFVSVFRCVLSLPSNAALRKVVGPYMPKKKLAKQAAVYRAAKKLHQLGAIDDNLIPVCDASSAMNDTTADESATLVKATKAKGTKASVQEYPIAVPSSFVQPPRTPAATGFSQDTESETCFTGYVPIAWYIYRIKLDHPLSETCAELAIATAQPLPPDTVVPLYTAQYAKGNTELDTSQSLIPVIYIGKQIMNSAQVDILASFSAKILMRVTQMALVWDIDEIGFLIGPLLLDSTGIDFDLAESFFKCRLPLAYSNPGSDYLHISKQMIMDGLDHGKLKIVERVCSDADIYANMVEYHARSKGIVGAGISTESLRKMAESSITEGESSETALTTEQLHESEEISKRLIRKHKSSRNAAKSISDWTYVKHMSNMLPEQEIGRGVPVFKVKPVVIMLNYLTTSVTHLNSAVVAGINEDSVDTDVQGYPESIYTSPFFSAAEPINISDVYSLSIIPAFMIRLEHVVKAASVKQRLRLTANVETVRQAITATTANMDVSYERLETLGDSVLKFITSVMLFVCYPSDHEGLLTSRRSKLVSNAHLFSVSKKLQLPEYMITRVFSRRDIRFPGFGWLRLCNVPRKWIAFVDKGLRRESDEDESDFSISSRSTDEIVDIVKQKRVAPDIQGHSLTIPACSRKHQLSEKTIADIVESLLGASFVDGGLEGALAAARSLCIVKPRWKSWSCFNDIWKEGNLRRQRDMDQLTGFCAAVIANAEQLPDREELVQETEMDQEDVIYSQAQMQQKAGPDSEALAPDVDWTSQIQFTHALASNRNDQWIKDIEMGLGYTFKNRALLIEALTHCSVSDSISDSYQRLEFLGDAVLDIFVTKRYYDYRPELRPYRITLVKHVAVSNDLLAIITVCHGFHRYIRHRSEVLAHALGDYEMRLSHARSVWAENNQQEADVTDAAGVKVDSKPIQHGEDTDMPCSGWEDSVHAATHLPPLSEAARSSAPEDETAVSGRPAKVRRVSSAKEAIDIYKNLPPECWNIVPAPKTLGDIFESLLGAVYIDSGMDNSVAQAVYEKIVCPFLDRFVDSGKLSLHPVIQCLLVCQGWGCDVITWTSRANSDLLEFVNKYICEVRAHGQVLATGMGESPRHAKHNAASSLLQKIGAVAPDALSGELNMMHKQLAGSDAIERLLKPICTCAERRQAEATAAAAAAATAYDAAENPEMR